MKKKIGVKKLLFLMLIVSLIFTINIPIKASKSMGLNEFEAGLKNNDTLNKFSKEDDVVNFITKEGKKAKLGQDDITKAVKEFYKGKMTDNDKKKREKQKIVDKSVKDEIDMHISLHEAKINKVERKIQESVDYETTSNYEKNIEFLLDNAKNIKLDKESILYYISCYYEQVNNSNIKERAEKFLGITPKEEISLESNADTDTVLNTISNLFIPSNALAASWSGASAKTYALNYCGTNLGGTDSTGYNTSNYPTYESISNANNDCANFGSQCLQAGGKSESGSDYGSASAWFCNTTSSTALTSCSLTWRYCPAFKTYWSSRCSTYKTVSVSNVTDWDNYTSEIYDFISYGDIIHLAYSDGTPVHTFIVTSYSVAGNADIGITCHTVNRKNYSLYDYICSTNSSYKLLLYHFS